MERDQSAPFAKLAVRFAEALTQRDFDAAHAMLCAGFRGAVTPDRLAKNYDEMIEYGEGPVTSVNLINTMARWPDRRPTDLGWAYVAISGDDFSEAVVVIIAEESGQPVVRHLEWGRP